MIHRTSLSTALLIAVRTGGRKTLNTKPSVAGIRITAKPATIQEKGQHSVNELGNIVPATGKKALALNRP